MNIFDSFLFLIILIVVLSTLQVSIFFIIFGGAIYLYLIIQLFLLDPINHTLSIGMSIIADPIGLFILFVPILIPYVVKKLKRRFNLKRTKN